MRHKTGLTGTRLIYLIKCGVQPEEIIPVVQRICPVARSKNDLAEQIRATAEYRIVEELEIIRNGAG